MLYPTEEAQQELVNDSLPFLRRTETPLEQLAPKHERFLRTILGIERPLPSKFLVLDASHPWMVFWPVNALQLLGRPLNALELERVGETIISCQHADGGFGGGPDQPGHIASTYGAVMALAYTDLRFFRQVNRQKFADWILRDLKTEEGGFRVCRHGEVDPRAAYCALATTTLLGICTPAIRRGVGEYLQRCQTYEGGFANTPFGEAHGGYTFCSLAALMLLVPENPLEGIKRYCNVRNLERWLINRQDMEVPGFQGRTNKLVDGCYSHWAGGCWPLLEQITNHEVWDRQGLKDYILKCCQSPNGGLRDKIGVGPDAYHTNYCLSGLASSEYKYRMGCSMFDWRAEPLDPEEEMSGVLPLHPVFGIVQEAVTKVHNWAVEEPELLLDLRLHQIVSTSHVAPSTREYQGFALYVAATLMLCVYALWALLPASWLHAMRIDYYPSRWWAIAIPAFILMLMLYIYILLASYNTEVLTFPPDAAQTLCDTETMVHDVPLKEVNMFTNKNPSTRIPAQKPQTHEH